MKPLFPVHGPSARAPSADARRTRSRRRLAALLMATAFLAVPAGAIHPAFAEVAPAADLPPELGGLNSLAGNYLAARLAGDEQDLAAAAAFYRSALAEDPTNPLLIERTFTLSLASGDVDAAIALAPDLRPTTDVNRLGRLTVAVDAFEAGKTAEARKTLAAKSRSPLIELTNALVIAWTYAADGNEKAALEALDALSNAEMFAAFTTYNGGLIADLLGDHHEAVVRLGDAYAGDPGLPRVVVAYARALARAGDRNEADSVVDRFADGVHDGPLVQGLERQVAEGKNGPPIVPNAKSGAATALAALGATIGREGSAELASAYLHLALHLDPKNEFGTVALAELYERMNKPKDAIRYYSALDPSSAFYREGQIQIGLNLNALDKVDDARKQLEKVIAGDPTDTGAVLALGAVLRSHDMFADAAKVYGDRIALIKNPEPADWLLFYNRGISYERTKQWDKAEPDFEEALKLSPDQPEVLNYLGYTWADQGVHLDKALAMIRKAVDLRPSDGAIVDSLGWALYRHGKFDEAVTYLERAVDLMPDDPTLNDHLGDAYWRVGRTVEARFQWAHARDMKPPKELAPQIEQKLKSGLPPLGPEPTQSAKTKPDVDPKAPPVADDAAPKAVPETPKAPADTPDAPGKAPAESPAPAPAAPPATP
ncbi:Tetratricopeptide repeat-containing protein [Pseudoxanthobacter soli DSM 19599]|uniref:Tetratricopeptide repeat-containing protein n=1 Tax=Pseudoxanthobacter soli DSM 19599 TaxID=1123029 RepID=A0A1M7Z4F6_9HYPH|nr:tetratricopeptide repeat protein [Pseudoxanthobacter soli]SHO59670.1 Tetratricopeptide repeat-containing protein [Pseudoxanthobacter soli DSM 19599]